MRKIANDTLLTVLTSEFGYEPEKAAKIAERCQRLEEQAAVKEPSAKRATTGYIVMVNDPDGKLPDDLTGWIVRKRPSVFDENGTVIPNSDPVEWGDLELEHRLEAWGREQAENPKFKSWRFCDLGDYIAEGKKTSAKEFGMQFVTKEPVYICGVNPNMPYHTEEGTEVTSTINSLN